MRMSEESGPGQCSWMSCGPACRHVTTSTPAAARRQNRRSSAAPASWSPSRRKRSPRSYRATRARAGQRGFPPSLKPVERAEQLRRRGLRLEYATLGWNLVGSGVVLAAAVVARSVALAGFGLDSLIEILASLVVVWQLQDMHEVERERRALRIIGIAFLLLAAYIAAQSAYVLAIAAHPHTSLLGIVWLALTAAAMFALAACKSRTGRALRNRVLQTEARVTVIDGLLATVVLVGLILNAAAGLWWADPAAAFVIVYYGAREGWLALHETVE